MDEHKKPLHLKVFRALPGFAKSEIDDLDESRFTNGADDIRRIYAEMTERMRAVRSSQPTDMIYELIAIDQSVSYDLNAIVAVVMYEK